MTLIEDLTGLARVFLGLMHESAVYGNPLAARRWPFPKCTDAGFAR